MDSDGILIEEYKLVHHEAEDIDLKRGIDHLSAKYIFSTKLGKEPARLLPLVLEVDDDKWELPKI